MCLSTRTLFPPNKHITCFTTFRLFVEIHFPSQLTGQGLVTGHWSSGGLVAGIQRSHCHGLTSVSGQRTEILLQAAAGRGHPRSPIASQSLVCHPPQTFNIPCPLPKPTHSVQGLPPPSQLRPLPESVFFFNKCIYLLNLFMAALGLHCCTRAFSSCGKWGLLFFAVRGLLVAVLLLLRSTGSRHAGFSSCGARASVVVVRGL